MRNRGGLRSLRGRARRAFFNEIAGGIVLGFALGGAMIGLALAGPIGALLGLGAGLAAGCSIAERNRFYRR